MKKIRFSLTMANILGVIILLNLFAPLAWGGVDVYLVYSGKNKAEKKAYMKTFSKEMKAKSYNVDLLALADYSGKQKAVTKFEKAKVIVIFNDRPVEILEGAKINKDLIIVQSVKKGIKSESIIYVVQKGTDLSPLGTNLKTRVIKKTSDLGDGKDVRSLDAMVIENEGLNLPVVVTALVNILLGR